MTKKKLPVGIDNFEKLRQENFYYVDKTYLLIDLLRSWSEVNLFTRPRRFGKTLNMSMLRYFFEIGADSSLFDGLAISAEKVLCDEYHGKYPVIFISLKDVDGLCLEDAQLRLKRLISEEAGRHSFLKTSDKIPEEDQRLYHALLLGEDADVPGSLRLLSRMLYRHYGKKVIILIDEYDVPLDKAFRNGYYDEMVSLLRSLLGQALKTNEFLQFAVLTGCLRVAKESIFTGLNNFRIFSITDKRCGEHFGFTETETVQLLRDYELEDHLTEIREWYDGYRFGEANIYCPWDVINYVDLLTSNPKAKPQTYWINSSGNDLVKRFIDKADKSTQNEIERLIAGESVEKRVRLDLTYNELDSSIENLWSVLFTTGYLTLKESAEEDMYRLVIPNREVREVFTLQIQDWFKETALSDTERINLFCRAFPEGDASAIQEMLNDYLWDSISIRDTAAQGRMKENFYHGLLLGLLRSQGRWLIRSNAETGDGYSDISICVSSQLGIVIEIKYAQDGDLEAACEKALQQIEEKQYAEGLIRQGMKKVIRYGIAFYRKECRVYID